MNDYINIRKISYFNNEKLKVYIKRKIDNGCIGIYNFNEEVEANTAILLKKVNGKNFIEFNLENLEVGLYYLYYFEEDSFYVYQKIDFYINDDDNNYQIKDAKMTVISNKYSKQISIKIIPSSLKKLTYIFYYAKNYKRLKNYSYIKKEIVENKSEFVVYFNECMNIANNANQIEICVLEGNSSSFYIHIDENLKVKKSKFLYQFAILTDLHIENEQKLIHHNNHLKKALLDVIDNTKKSEAIFVIGDHSNHGTDENYLCLNKIINNVNAKNQLPKMYFALGNHEYIYGDDYNSQVDLFLKYLKMENVYYSVSINDNKFIVLGSSSIIGEGTIDDSLLSWFKKQLESTRKDSFTFIFLHQPLKNTVSGSLYDLNPKIQYWYGIDKEKEIKQLLKEYPNAILFSGHTHWTFNAYKPLCFGNMENASFLNCASVGYLWDDFDQEVSGSEGVYVEVYQDYLLIKAKEFIDDKYIPSGQFVIPLFKNDKF